MDGSDTSTDRADRVLIQFGVKGMKWGVRKRRVNGPVDVTMRQAPGKRIKTEGGQGQPASEDAKRASISKQKARASTTDSLTTPELRDLVNRLQLEANYRKLDPPPETVGSIIGGFLKKRGQEEAGKLARGDLSTINQIEGLINKKKLAKTAVKAAT